MTRDEMQNAIQPLENYYKKVLEDVEIDVWYENFKEISIGRFRLIVSECYKKCKYMPKLSELWDIHRDIAYIPPTEEKSIVGHCSKCEDTRRCILYKRNKWNTL